MFNLKKTPQAIIKSSAKNPTFRIVAMDNGDVPEILIMDIIGKDFWGDGIAAGEVMTFLSKHKDSEVKARFNSFGGDAYEGIVMHNAFKEHGNVTATIEGIAFSAAAIAVSGANRIEMQAESDFGIHRSWTGVWGNVNDLKGAIEWLEAVDEHQIKMFMNRTGASREQIVSWLEGTSDGTIFPANEAIEHGFADGIVGQSSTATETTAATASKRIAAELRHKTRMNRLSRKTG